MVFNISYKVDISRAPSKLRGYVQTTFRDIWVFSESYLRLRPTVWQVAWSGVTIYMYQVRLLCCQISVSTSDIKQQRQLLTLTLVCASTFCMSVYKNASKNMYDY